MVFNKIQDLFVDIMGVDPEEVTPETAIYDELDADSLDISQILLALENHFDIELEDDAAANMDTVSELVDHVQAKVGS